MNDRSVFDNSLDKKRDWLEELHRTLEESQHSTIVFTLQNESDFPSMLREYAPIVTYDRILELGMGNRVMEDIHTFLETCNIPDSRNGTSYIYECIFLIRKYKDEKYAVTKDIYPEIAKRNRTSAAVVESAIRSCIKQTWEETREGSEKGMRTLFQKRPSNLVFIRKLCEFIENGELHFCK